MKLIQCRFSSGQRVPLLVHAGNAAPLPIVIPFIYVQLKLRYRAYNTAAAHLRSIQAFYTYAESRGLDFDGQFRLGGREANVFRVIPRRVTLLDINRALGNDEKYPSIFSRRSLTESNGAPIRLTSHQPRHWRNTIYHLTGMSDVQQALALGRKRLDQNVYYQHTSIEENTAAHHEFLAFNSHHERIDFLHTGIRDKRIQGALTDSYHALLSDKGTTTAEAFLTVHATALHVTPFGGCIHDFSQAPCPKHLQCWNGCSHLQ
ncbi:hypothetical protein [Pseudomonas sp. LG1D9]|uniref:hypothetical protein n=1 Tax=Pseudomonas sp. LG1D9 TaxID=2083054 RepID=UPI00211563DE|nr:hypothetical protein [Pseudomonas sp. LG1D9]